MADLPATPIADGRVHDPARLADIAAIQDLAVSYGYAVDDRDWSRFEALFVADATIDYTATGGISGTPATVAAWMPDAMSVFTWCLHTISNHEIRFTGADEAVGRVHLLNRNGLQWDGRSELLDVGGLYLDEYVRVGEHWRFRRRFEHLHYLQGGAFAEVVRSLSSLPSN